MQNLKEICQNNVITVFLLLTLLLIGAVAIIGITARYFRNLTQYEQDKSRLKTNILILKSFLEKNEQISDFRHGYNSSLPPKVFLSFEKTIFGKLFKFIGSISITVTIMFRALSFRNESILGYIYNIESVKLMLAIFGSIYSIYVLIYCICAFKNSFVYIITGKWLKRNSPVNIRASARRIFGSIFTNGATAIKLIGGLGATGLTIDQTQDLLGVSDYNKWRVKKNARDLGNYLGISDIKVEKTNSLVQQNELDIKMGRNNNRV